MTSRSGATVLRVTRGGVVRSWRRREHELRQLGYDVDLVSASTWNEGGAVVRIEHPTEPFVVPTGTLGRHPFLFLYSPLPIIRRMLSKGYAVLDAHEEPASVAAAELLLLRRLFAPQSKLVLYSAENIFKRYPAPFRWIERVALRRAAGVYVCNADADGVLRRKGFNGHIAVIPLGVDTASFRPRPRTEDSSTLRCGYIGRLTERKGVHVLLDAITELTWCHVDFVGGGPERERLEVAIASRDLGHRVRLLGHRSADDLPELYSSFDVVVVPSQPTPRWQEQFCRVAVEAMAAGVPVVASRTGALPEVIGNAGVLVTPGHPEDLANALASLQEDRQKRARLSELAITQASKCAWPEVAKRHAAFYDEALRATDR